MFIEIGAMFWVNLGLVPIACFLLGSCWFAMAFVEDIINDLKVLDDYGKWKKNPWKLKQQFHFIVQNIADMKQLSTVTDFFFIHNALIAANNYKKKLFYIYRFLDNLNALYQFTNICIFGWSVSVTGVLIFAVEKLIVEYCIRMYTLHIRTLLSI